MLTCLCRTWLLTPFSIPSTEKSQGIYTQNLTLFKLYNYILDLFIYLIIFNIILFGFFFFTCHFDVMHLVDFYINRFTSFTNHVSLCDFFHGWFYLRFILTSGFHLLNLLRVLDIPYIFLTGQSFTHDLFKNKSILRYLFSDMISLVIYFNEWFLFTLFFTGYFYLLPSFHQWFSFIYDLFGD